MPESSRTYGILQPAGFPPLPPGWTTRIETYPGFDEKLHIFSATHLAPHAASMASSASRKKPLRVLAIAHGIGEHGGRYLHFPSFLEGTVDVVFCPDHRGHGRSEGLRGHVERFTDFSEDFRVGIERLSASFEAPLEIHALGHSMGSLILMNLLHDHRELPIVSATLSSPMLGMVVEVPLIKRAAAGLLSDIWGKLQMSTGLNAATLSHDPAVVETYRRDRLVHSLCTPRLFTEMTRSMKYMAKHPGTIPYPLLAQVPMADEILSPVAAIAFAEASKAQLKTYAGFFHESYNETGKKQAFEDLKTWIAQNSAGR
jgi:alpha-beta hydrolase superfamily lysophospholipase